MDNLFEGYVGIRLWDGQVLNDLLFSLLIGLLFLFALAFRLHYRSFLKMVKDVFYTKERQSLFENGVASDHYFRQFMLFHALVLCSLFAFSRLYINDLITFELTSHSILLCLGGIFGIVALFYFFKQIMYAITANIFSDNNKYKLWKNSYLAIMGSWGILLYIPVIWSIFWGAYPVLPVILFVLFYILCRFAIIYKTLRIFHKKNTGLLYINLYLCAQEILPLVFLYEGMVYLYNFIKTSTLWH
ncbi:MAG: DUF4271 domain-containing protein [Massilibacteroides sp.]|nr:DUF4271 domain-containing protein [Massilibacteroides sp.]